MESLQGTEWDVVIAGTGIDESLLALALSRSGKKVLHIDSNGYYGGPAAALSLQDAEAWAQAVNHDGKCSSVFANASITQSDAPLSQLSNNDSIRLGFSRAYSLALAPDIIYARSSLLSSLVSAKVDAQLEFLAMGSWWMCYHDDETKSVTKVPSGREDLFTDKRVDAKTKRTLIKFLRFVSSYEDDEEWRYSKDKPFAQFLQSRFGLQPVMQRPIHALVMSPYGHEDTTTEHAIKRITRHLRSIGLFGQGFGAVVPKWGGLAEITQVGCRGCAVGGGTYVLGYGVESQVHREQEKSSPKPVQLKLSNGNVVRTDLVAYGPENVSAMKDDTANSTTTMSRSISIVASSLMKFFPQAAEGTPSPTGAVVCVSLPEQAETVPPIRIIVHSSDTGECPAGQCILYASVALPAARGLPLLDSAVALLLSRVDPAASVLWTLHYEQRCSTNMISSPARPDDKTIVFPPPPLDTVFDDAVLDRVRSAWRTVIGEDAHDADFLNFAPRGEDGNEESMDMLDQDTTL